MISEKHGYIPEVALNSFQSDHCCLPFLLPAFLFCLPRITVPMVVDGNFEYRVSIHVDPISGTGPLLDLYSKAFGNYFSRPFAMRAAGYEKRIFPWFKGKNKAFKI